MSSLICNFLVTVGANVVSYYICKWLDSYRKGKKPKRTPSERNSEGVRFCERHELTSQLPLTTFIICQTAKISSHLEKSLLLRT